MRAISAVVISAFIGSCAPTIPLLDQIRTSGELRVITRNAPTTFYHGANEAYGIEYELAQAFANHLGVHLHLIEADRAWEVLPAVAEHRVHIAAAGLAVTDPRREVVDFGPAYQTVRPLVIYRMGSNRPESLADLAGANLEVRAESSHIGMLYAALDEIPELAWAENRSTSAETLMQRVAAGTIEYAIVNSHEFSLLQHYYPEVMAAFELDYGNALAWALPQGADDLREEVGRFFARIQANGELEQILDRYYEAARDFDFVGSRNFVTHLRERFPQYQASFEAAEAETGIDWRLLAAIGYQESHWDANAVSPTGVKGLMMLTANTARQLGVTDRNDPHESILGGARYLARVLEKFPERIPYEDRILMAIAAYNIGFGHVEDARIITESVDADKDSWEDVRASLPLLADEGWYPELRHGYAQGAVPVQYVDNVQHYFWLLERLRGTEVLSAVTEPTAIEASVETPANTNPI